MHAPRVVRIASRRRDSPRHVTLTFQDPLMGDFGPGQFVMVWVPGVDEVPMALAGPSDGPYALTVEAKGDCSTALTRLGEGDPIGVRGPYGNTFSPEGTDVLAVAGGTGTVPMVPLAQQLTAEHRRLRIVIGGRDKDNLLLVDELRAAGAEVHEATDDGSQGFHGRAPDLAARLIAERRPDAVVTCGPEPMMKAVAAQCWEAGIPVQASLERWMKCALGICDACLVDGVRLCRDGPVLDGDVLRGLEDFGAYERGPDGRRQGLH